MAFIPLKNFLSIWHLKLTGPRAVSERVKAGRGGQREEALLDRTIGV
jgi:hypothetical protein